MTEKIKCRVAELIVEIPTAGGMSSRCAEYLCEDSNSVDIIIQKHLYRSEPWPGANDEMIAYMESGVQFYTYLLRFQGLMLHASAVALDGKAYLFSGPCGMGKSTHTKLWQQTFGSAAQVFNDDKPPLRYIDGKWYAYGAPWCGKDGINLNMKVPLAGICFLKQANKNVIRQLSPAEALAKIVPQTRRQFATMESLNLMLENVEQLIKDIPVFELWNRPEPDAARLSYETMRKKAEEMGL